jgi:hypothetical protein
MRGGGKPVFQAQSAEQLVPFKILHIGFVLSVHGMLGPAQGETTILLILLGWYHVNLLFDRTIVRLHTC